MYLSFILVIMATFEMKSSMVLHANFPHSVCLLGSFCINVLVWYLLHWLVITTNAFLNFKGMIIFFCAGIGYSWPLADYFGLWFVAFYGSPLWNCPDFHSCRFLLLLRQKVNNMLLFCKIPALYFYNEHTLKVSSGCSLVGGQLVLRLPSGVV